MNVDSTVGSCGFIFAVFPSLHPAKLIRINPKTGEIVRGKDGLALQCEPRQPGHIVGKVVEDGNYLMWNLPQAAQAINLFNSLFNMALKVKEPTYAVVN